MISWDAFNARSTCSRESSTLPRSSASRALASRCTTVSLSAERLPTTVGEQVGVVRVTIIPRSRVLVTFRVGEALCVAYALSWLRRLPYGRRRGA
jgi:hypothetical protein